MTFDVRGRLPYLLSKHISTSYFPCQFQRHIVDDDDDDLDGFQKNILMITTDTSCKIIVS